jgi:hypothetical protein
MLAPSITHPKKTPSPIGYSPVHAVHKDAIVTPDLDLTSYVLEDYHTKMIPPTDIDPNLTIQFIEFTYCNDRFSPETLEAKHSKYIPLIDSIAAKGWKIDPLIIITSGAKATTHIPSMKSLENKFKIPMPTIKNTFKNINTIAIKYAMSILLHKRRLENHQPLPQTLEPP